MENLDVNKNSWKIYSKNFLKLFLFTISVVIVFCVCVTLFFLFNNTGLFSLIIFFAGVAPLFYCLQIVVLKFASGKDVEYNEFYKPYKGYFSSQNRGSYKLIRNVFLSILMIYLAVMISFFVYDIFHYGEFEKIINEYYSSSMSLNDYNNMFNDLFNMKNYAYYFVISMFIPFLFFFNRIKNRLMIPYFNLIMPLPSFICNSIAKKVNKENSSFIKKQTRSGNLMFSLLFVFGYCLTGILCTTFIVDSNSSLILSIVLSLCGGLFISSFVLPPALFNYCFVADKLNFSFMKILKIELKTIINDSKVPLDDDSKELLKSIVNSLDKSLDEDDKDN